MLISTWNVRGHTRDKDNFILGLVRSSDFVCLTETWSTININDHWESVNASAPGSRGGGVSILYKTGSSFKVIATHAEQRFQLIHGVADGIPILGAYLTPRLPKQELQRVLATAARCMRGLGILVGDLNGRHNKWDVTYNMQGAEIHRWARRHSFLTTRPPERTFVSHSGSSRVDLVFHRSPVPQLLRSIPKPDTQITEP